MIKHQILWDFRALDYMQHSLSGSTTDYRDDLKSTLKQNEWFRSVSKTISQVRNVHFVW